MSDDRHVEAAKTAWQSQHVDEPLLSIDYLRNRAMEHTTRGRARTVVEYLCAGVTIVMGVWFAALVGGALFRVGVLVMLAGCLYSLYALRRRRLTWALALEGTAAEALHFYKQELARLRDLHGGLWKVYLPASVPGAVLLLAWIFLERRGPDNVWRIVGLTCGVAVWIVAMLRHEAQEAQRYQRELDALE